MKQPIIKVKDIVTGYHNDKNYAILWIKTDNGYSVGCLTNANEPKFDNINIGDYAMMQGKTHHLEKHNSLILSRGCEVTQ